MSFDTYLKEKAQNADVDLVTQLFFLARNSATQAHYLHLMTDRYAEHIALNEFYDGIIPLIDSFVESYTGKFGKISKTMPTNVPYLTVQEFKYWVEENREKITDASELQNILDEIVSFCDSIIYKLEHLK